MSALTRVVELEPADALPTKRDAGYAPLGGIDRHAPAALARPVRARDAAIGAVEFASHWDESPRALRRRRAVPEFVDGHNLSPGWLLLLCAIGAITISAIAAVAIAAARAAFQAFT